MRYRKISCMMASVLLFSLCGCSAIEEHLTGDLENTFFAQISEDDGYLLYQELLSKGLLDENGCYVGETSEQTEDAGVQVTFAENAAFDTAFYYDEAGQRPVEGAECILQAGEQIYAKEPSRTNTAVPGYRFTGYRIWAYDSDGNRNEYGSDLTSGLLLEVPEDAGITGFSIEILGGYAEKTIQLSDFCRQKNGDKQELNGIWQINELETHDISAQISLLNPYTVKYLYDPTTHYVVSTSPETELNNTAEGVVSFHMTEDYYETSQYTVELANYVMASVQDEKAVVTEILVDGKAQESEE